MLLVSAHYFCNASFSGRMLSVQLSAKLIAREGLL